MNDYLEKLLNGAKVEWVPLGEITKYEQPTKYIVSSTRYNNRYDTPVLTAGNTFILGYTDEKSGIYPAAKSPAIIFDDFTTDKRWVDFDFKVKSSAMKIITSKDENRFLLKYIYYWLANQPSELIDGDHKRQWISKFAHKKIPIPCPNNPLSSKRIQAKIAGILDAFSQLTAEYNMRKLKYQGVLEEIFKFKSIKKVKLRDIVIRASSGCTPAKSNPNFYENGDIPWIRTQDVNFNEILAVDTFITEEAARNTAAKWIPENCVIVAISGATAGRCAINKFRAATNQHCLNLEIDSQKALYKYVFYSICSLYQNLISKKQGARGDLNSSLILDTEIPLPSLSTQARIVSDLDKFDTLTNSITNGIPREIYLRKQQLIYYRDYLFDFPGKPGK